MVPKPGNRTVSGTYNNICGSKKPMEERNMSVISMKQLLEAGVHFGHQTRRWNPKMAPILLERTIMLIFLRPMRLDLINL